MRKFRASMEPFWDLRISKSVEYLTCVPREYFTSSVLPSLTINDSQTSYFVLGYVIRWINTASLTHASTRSVPYHTRSQDWKLLSLSLWSKHRNLSLPRSRVGLRLHLCDWGERFDTHVHFCVKFKILKLANFPIFMCMRGWNQPMGMTHQAWPCPDIERKQSRSS